jgi:lipoprotein-anchoring transpeptidase ErfK/SrfK
MGSRALSTAAILAAVLLPQSATAAPAATSVVAQARGHAVALFRSPKAKHPFLVLTNPTPAGGDLVFLVRQRIAGWDQVYEPVRPNGSLAWIKSRAVVLSLDPYRVVVRLKSRRLEIFKGRRLIDREKASVGRTVLPTPTGVYFIAELLQQPNRFGPYGPYAFGLSAYSNVLYSFGGGPGQIGIHGTDDPSSLGNDVSHGCIRISNAGITKLAKFLPLGTPVLIRDS